MVQEVEKLVRYLSSLPEKNQAFLAQKFLDEAKLETNFIDSDKEFFFDIIFQETKTALEQKTAMDLDDFIARAEKFNQST